jgi:hypothetical protein
MDAPVWWYATHFTAQYMHKLDDEQRKVCGKMLKNREHVRRCLVCNIHLCHVCENEFHGVRMCETAKLLGNKYFRKLLLMWVAYH